MILTVMNNDNYNIYDFILQFSGTIALQMISQFSKKNFSALLANLLTNIESDGVT